MGDVILNGFCIRRFPTVSNYYLRNGPGMESFDSWSKKQIDQFDWAYQVRLNNSLAEVRILTSLGCLKVTIAPDAVGKLRLDIWKSYLAEQTKGSFILVVSWSSFCPEMMLREMLDIALTYGCYVIKPEHLPLVKLHLDPTELYSSYQSWVLSGLSSDNEAELSRSDQLRDLLLRGFSTDEVLSEMGISRSTLFRIKKELKMHRRTMSNSSDEPRDT